MAPPAVHAIGNLYTGFELCVTFHYKPWSHSALWTL